MGDDLSTDVLLHGHGEVRASLHRGIVGHEEAFSTVHNPDAGHDARAWGAVVVQAVGGQRRGFEEGRAWVDDRLDALPGEHLVTGPMPLYGSWAASGPRLSQTLTEILHQREVGGAACCGLSVLGENRLGRRSMSLPHSRGAQKCASSIRRHRLTRQG